MPQLTLNRIGSGRSRSFREPEPNSSALQAMTVERDGWANAPNNADIGDIVEVYSLNSNVGLFEVSAVTVN